MRQDDDRRRQQKTLASKEKTPDSLDRQEPLIRAGSQGVRGSNPLSSTTRDPSEAWGCSSAATRALGRGGHEAVAGGLRDGAQSPGWLRLPDESVVEVNDSAFFDFGDCSLNDDWRAGKDSEQRILCLLAP